MKIKTTMKKNILRLVFASAFALVAGYSVYASLQKVEMSDLVMANVEALAGCEWNNWIGEPVYHITLTGYCSWTCTRGGIFQCPI